MTAILYNLQFLFFFRYLSFLSPQQYRRFRKTFPRWERVRENKRGFLLSGRTRRTYFQRRIINRRRVSEASISRPFKNSRSYVIYDYFPTSPPVRFRIKIRAEKYLRKASTGRTSRRHGVGIDHREKFREIENYRPVKNSTRKTKFLSTCLNCSLKLSLLLVY